MDFLTVRGGKMPGLISSVVLEGGATVADALAQANITVENGQEIRMDNNTVSLDTEVTNNALIIVTKMIKGN